MDWLRSACPTSRCGTRRTSPTSGTPTHAGCDGRIRPVGVLLHHKTLAVLVDGRPQTLLCGSFNWSTRSAKAYENLIVLTADDPASMRVMTAVEREFEALWSDGAATLSPDEVPYALRRNSGRVPEKIRRVLPPMWSGWTRGAGAPLDVLREAERTAVQSICRTCRLPSARACRSKPRPLPGMPRPTG